MRKYFMLLTVLALVLTASSVFASNMLPNPSAEIGTDPNADYWVNSWGTAGAVTDPSIARTGSRCWACTAADGTGIANFASGGQVTAVKPGETFTFSAWVKAPAATPTHQIKVRLRWGFYDAGGGGWASVQGGTYAYLTSGDWTLVTAPAITCPADGVYLVTRVYCYNAYRESDTGADIAGTTDIYPVYIDDLSANSPEYTYASVSGAVTDGGVGVAGVVVKATQTDNGLISVTAAPTSASGAYSMVCRVGKEYQLSASSLPGGKMIGTVPGPFTPADETPITGKNITLTADPNYDPNMYFNALSSAFTGNAGDPTGNWPTVNPAGVQMAAMGTPTVAELNGQKMAMNKADGDGFHFTNIPWNNGTPDSIFGWNGGSIVVTCRPYRTATGNAYQQLVSVLLNQFAIGIQRDNGRLHVWRGGTEYWSEYYVPNGQVTTFSFVVQPTGEFKVFANGTQVMNETSTFAFSTLTPAMWYGTDVNVGKGWNGDGWSSFNGGIGDVYVYKIALDDTARQALETSLINKFGSAPTYNIVASSTGTGTISPAGTTAVPGNTDQTYTITPAIGWAISDVLVDGVSAGAISTYTFANVTAAHTIAVTFTQLPTVAVTGKVTDGVNGILNAMVYAKQTAGASVNPNFTTATVDAEGNYSITLPVGTWFMAADAEGFDVCADSTVTVVEPGVTGVDFALTVNPNWDLLFAATVDQFSALNSGDLTGNWTPIYPAGAMLNALATPTAIPVGGINWIAIDRDDTIGNDGFELTGVPYVVSGQSGVNTVGDKGVTVIAVAQPKYNTTIGGEARGEIVSLYYNGLTLCVDHATGEVMISRKAWNWVRTGYIIPDGQKTILSLVCQLDGSAKLYANKTEVWTGAALGADYYAMLTGGDGPTSWQNRIGVGRNPWDGWSSFSGNIGDVYVYKNAISSARRAELETALGAKFGIAIPDTAFSGKVTLEDGVTPVAGALITAVGESSTSTATSAADGTYGFDLNGGEIYYITATKDSYMQVSADWYDLVSAPTVYDFQMRLINAVQGTITDALGQPINNAVVQVGEGGPAAVTGPDGKYLVQGITPGAGVSFYADALGFGAYTEVIDTTLASEGVITKNAALNAKSELGVIQNGGFETAAIAPWYLNTGDPEVGVTTDEKASGTYAGFWRATVAGYYRGYLAYRLPVLPGSTYNIYFKLKTNVTGVEGQCGFDWLNASGGSLMWWGYAGGGTNWMYTPVPGVWEQALNYRSWDNSQHTTAVRLTPPAETTQIQIIVGMGAQNIGDTMFVDDVVIDRVGPDPTSITGKVTAGAGGPGVPGAVVFASSTSPAGPSVNYATTDANGFYTILNVMPGTFYLTARKGGYTCVADVTVVAGSTPATAADIVMNTAATSKLVDLKAANYANGTWTNTGTLGGAFNCDTTSVPGVVAAGGYDAVSFDGTARLLGNITAPAQITGNGSWTVSGWLYGAPGSTYGTYLAWARGMGGAPASACFLYDTDPGWGAGDFGALGVGLGTAPAASAWHNVVVTYDHAMARVYVDGVLTSTMAGILDQIAGSPFSVGATYDVDGGATPKWFLTGQVASIEVYDFDKSAADVAALYNAGPDGNGLVVAKPVGVNNKSVLTDPKLAGKTVRVWGKIISKGASSYVIDDGYGAGVTINGTTAVAVDQMAVVTGVVQANKSVTP